MGGNAMNVKKRNRKTVLGVLNRLAAYANARKGIASPHSIRASVEIDRKLLWRWRKVSETGHDDKPLK